MDKVCTMSGSMLEQGFQVHNSSLWPHISCWWDCCSKKMPQLNLFLFWNCNFVITVDYDSRTTKMCWIDWLSSSWEIFWKLQFKNVIGGVRTFWAPLWLLLYIKYLFWNKNPVVSFFNRGKAEPKVLGKALCERI